MSPEADLFHWCVTFRTGNEEMEICSKVSIYFFSYFFWPSCTVKNMVIKKSWWNIPNCHLFYFINVVFFTRPVLQSTVMPCDQPDRLMTPEHLHLCLVMCLCGVRGSGVHVILCCVLGKKFSLLSGGHASLCGVVMLCSRRWSSYNLSKVNLTSHVVSGDEAAVPQLAAHQPWQLWQQAAHAGVSLQWGDGLHRGAWNEVCVCVRLYEYGNLD